VTLNWEENYDVTRGHRSRVGMFVTNPVWKSQLSVPHGANL